MPRDYLRIDTNSAQSTSLASKTATLIDHCRQAINLGNQIKDVFDHNTDAGDFSDIQLLIGLKGIAGSAATEADAEALYNLVTGTLAELEADTNLLQLIARVSV